MKELYRFRQFLTEGVIKKEVTINGKTIDVSSIKIEGVDTSQGYDDGTTGAFASYAEFKDGSELSDNELDKLTDENPDLIHELALEVFQMGESTDGVIKEDNVFRDKKGSFRNQYSIGNASDIYDDFETYYERWEDEFVEGNSFNFDDEDEWNETNTPGDKVASHSWEIGYEEEDDYYKPIIYNMLNYLKKNKIYKYKNDDGIDAEFTLDDRGNSIDMVIYYTAKDIEKYKN